MHQHEQHDPGHAEKMQQPRALVVATLVEAHALDEVATGSLEVVGTGLARTEERSERDRDDQRCSAATRNDLATTSPWNRQADGEPTPTREAHGFAMAGLGVVYVLKSVLLFPVSTPFGLRPIEPLTGGAGAAVPSL